MGRLRELDPGASIASYFGSELRYYRTAAGYSQEHLGSLINYTGALVCMVETGKRPPSLDFTKRCDEALNTGGALERIWPLVNRQNFPDWLRTYVDLEATATVIRDFQPTVVPGLVQTEDYMRAQLACLPRPNSRTIDELIAARMSRQAILGNDLPSLLWFIVDESVLHRSIGGTSVMRAQLRRLLEVGELPQVVLQVVPYSTGAYAGLDGPLTIFSFDDGPDIAYTEGHARCATVIHQPDRLGECNLALELTQAAALAPQSSASLIKATMEGL
jgi:transcriptional regulator with XRE-family HTH domain